MGQDVVKKSYQLDRCTGPFADGLSLAHALIQDALQHVVFYTKGCPACTAAVLGSMFDLSFEGCDRIHNTLQGGKLELMEDLGDASYAAVSVLSDQHRADMRARLVFYLREAKKRGARLHIEDSGEEGVMH